MKECPHQENTKSNKEKMCRREKEKNFTNTITPKIHGIPGRIKQRIFRTKVDI